jgi:hypothetical protein
VVKVPVVRMAAMLLDGGFVGAACFGITKQGDELSGERVHRQAGE